MEISGFHNRNAHKKFNLAELLKDNLNGFTGLIFTPEQCPRAMLIGLEDFSPDPNFMIVHTDKITHLPPRSSNPVTDYNVIAVDGQRVVNYLVAKYLPNNIPGMFIEIWVMVIQMIRSEIDKQLWNSMPKNLLGIDAIKLIESINEQAAFFIHDQLNSSSKHQDIEMLSISTDSIICSVIGICHFDIFEIVDFNRNTYKPEAILKVLEMTATDFNKDPNYWLSPLV